MVFFLLDILLLLLLSPLIYLLHVIFRKKHKCELKGKTIVITGGSKGIGKALALECAKEGPKRIILIARNLTELTNATKEIANIDSTIEAHAISCDVTDKNAVKQVTTLLETHSIRSIDFLFLVHGASYPGYIMEQNVELFEKQMQLNYFGGVYITKEFLPMLMRDRKKEQNKHIVFVTSALAICTFVGYGSYSPTKYAIRGFAETLHSELQGHGIDVHISLPSDTDTDGFKNENLTKPKECDEISGQIKVQMPDQPARAILRDMKKGRFYLYDSFDLGLLVGVTQGVTPRRCPVWSPIIGALGSFIAIFIHSSWSNVSKKYAPQREKLFANLIKDTSETIVLEEATENSKLL